METGPDAMQRYLLDNTQLTREEIAEHAAPLSPYYAAIAAAIAEQHRHATWTEEKWATLAQHRRAVQELLYFVQTLLRARPVPPFPLLPLPCPSSE